MNLRTVILAFLAERYPAAYDPAVILLRVNTCGLLDRRACRADVEDELRTLANRMGLVETVSDRVSGAVTWTANQDGLRQWHLDGQTHIS